MGKLNCYWKWQGKDAVRKLTICDNTTEQQSMIVRVNYYNENLPNYYIIVLGYIIFSVLYYITQLCDNLPVSNTNIYTNTIKNKKIKKCS